MAGGDVARRKNTSAPVNLFFGIKTGQGGKNIKEFVFWRGGLTMKTKRKTNILLTGLFVLALGAAVFPAIREDREAASVAPVIDTAAPVIDKRTVPPAEVAEPGVTGSDRGGTPNRGGINDRRNAKTVEGKQDIDSKPESYVIEKGDSLWSVSRKFGIEPDLLARANGIGSEDFLYEGESLNVPEGEASVYTVSKGDTLWGLANRFNITIESLAEYNGIENGEFLPAGKSLLIPLGNSLTGPDDKDTFIRIPQLELWPVSGVVSSAFGTRNGRMHEGIDIAADWGKPIVAVAEGRVVFAGSRGSYGKTVIINHGGGFRSLYGHASRIDVSPGETVRKGQVIARVGSTGRSTGPHLHIELLYRGVPVDPEKYLPDKI